eukprot:6214634-Pleurochrysis_carterae.AAC.3
MLEGGATGGAGRDCAQDVVQVRIGARPKEKQLNLRGIVAMGGVSMGDQGARIAVIGSQQHRRYIINHILYCPRRMFIVTCSDMKGSGFGTKS